MSQEMNRDDALFEQLNKNKKRRRRKILITVITILLVVAVVLVFTVSYLRRHVQQTYGSQGSNVESAIAVTGTLSTVVSGTGVLAEDELESITVPTGVEITDVLVEAYETVAEGQALATVDMASVLTAMNALQEEMKTLDKQISDASDDAVSANVTTGVAGRVKILYGEVGMSVPQCMTQYGALAVLSLDGYMAVDLQTEQAAPGDEVTVTLSDGKSVKGTVDSVIAGTATVLLTDDGPKYDEEVTVTLGDTFLGSGRLYIHEPLAITGYAGTIQAVNTGENRKIYRGSSLFRLTDTATTHTYDTLLRSRTELEETLLELLQLQRTGAVTAPFAGSVITVDYEETMAPGAVATLSPDLQMIVSLTVDESDILSLEVGQEAEVTVSSLSDEPFMGTVTEIDRSTATSGSYSAVVTLRKAEGMLSGMTADVNIRITGVENALLIPIEALQQTRTGAFVYTTYDPETDTFGGEKPVTAGIMGSNDVEILSGLTEGETVWYIREFNIFDFFSNMGGMGGPSSGGNRPSGGGMPGGPGGQGGRP